MPKPIIAPHENADYAGYGGTPIGNNEYTLPTIGMSPIIPPLSLSSPTSYTHPGSVDPGMIRKGFVWQNQPSAGSTRSLKTGQ